MVDIVQKVKYQVEVNTSELDRFKTAVDETNAAIGRLNTAFRGLSTSIDQGMLKALSTLNGRLSRFTTVATPAVDQLEKMVAPMSGLATAMTRAAEQFAAFTTSTNRALDDLRKFNAEMGRTKRETEESAAVQERSGHKLSLAWLKVYGIFQTVKFSARAVFDFLKEGAQQLDLEQILSKQVDGFERQINRARELTAGVVDRGSLTRSFALMSSFGIPMDKFAENMELVQKMAIRTGQSADFLTESFARGISRLSPLILDNLGIQVSLSEANTTYANATGKVVAELTKEERIAALLDQVLGKLRENTRGVSLETGSAAASVLRFETQIKDAKDEVGKFAASIESLLAFMGGGKSQTFERGAQMFDPLVNALKLTDDLIQKTGGGKSNLSTPFEAMTEALRSMKGMDVSLFGDALDNMSDGISRFMMLRSQLPQASSDFQTVLMSFRAARQEILHDYPMGDATSAGLGGAIATFTQNLGIARSALQEVGNLYGGVISSTDMAALAAKEEAAAHQRSKDALLGATIAQKVFGVPLAVALAANYERVSRNAESYHQSVVEAGKALAFVSLGNKVLLDMDHARLKLEVDMNALNERMFQLKNGQILSEVNLNEVIEERSAVVSELAKVEKALAEDQFDSNARLERDRLLARLRELNAIRDNKQAQLLADKEILASFQVMTKEKLKSIKDFYLASIKMLEVTLMAVPGSAQVKEQIQSFKNMIAELDKIINRGGRGGGGGVREEYEPFKPIKNAKPTYYGWTIDDLLEVGGKLQEMREGFSIGGQVPGGFLGDSNFFGSVSADELKKAQDRLAEFDKARSAALGRFRSANMQERGLLGAFSDEASVEAFRARLQQLADHFRILDQISTHLENTSVAMGTFRDGMDDLFGSDVIGMVTDFTSGMEGFTEALRANAGAYGLVNAAMPMVHAFTQNIIKNRKAQAGIEALMQGAASWAAYAEGNIAGGTMHAIAAGMYLAVAGGVLRLPKGKGKDTKPDDSSVKSQAVKGGDRHFHWHGQIATTEAERGAMIRDMIREAERAGI